MAEMQRVGLGEPHVAVNPCAFVKPTVAEAGVHADDDVILGSVVQKVGDIKTEGRVAVIVAAHEVSVDENKGVAKCAVESEGDAAAAIAGRNIKAPAVPAHTG